MQVGPLIVGSAAGPARYGRQCNTGDRCHPKSLISPTDRPGEEKRRWRMTLNPVATLEGVTHRYGAVEALSRVTLALRPGEVTALLGPNGAGKTTIVRLLTGLSRPTIGTARLFGERPQSLTARRRLGVMLQVGRVPDTLTVREHVRLFSSYYPSPLPERDVIALAGLESVANRRYGRLSGGQQQRVLFALAICGNPDLLFLDEPTVGMDVESRRRFWASIRQLARAGRSILLTTHYLEEADALAARIVVVNRGRIVADDTPSALKQRSAGRQIRCHTALAAAALSVLPGVQHVSAEPDGRTLLLTADSDRTLRALLAADDTAATIDVQGAALEDAFLKLTADHDAVGAA
jgi:ABC-2 type transport system ATP-binding protein